MGHSDLDPVRRDMLSATKPSGYQGYWIPLDPNAKFAWFRQVSYDWGREIDARLAIECLDANPVKARLSAAETDSRLREMLVFTKTFTDFWLNYQQRLKSGLPSNKFHFSTFDDQVMKKQAYWEGIFEFNEG